MFAVCQHIPFEEFADHPDSDFKGVIRASKGTLTIMAPFESPLAFTRVWCLYEQFETLRQGKTLDLYPPRCGTESVMRLSQPLSILLSTPHMC